MKKKAIATCSALVCILLFIVLAKTINGYFHQDERVKLLKEALLQDSSCSEITYSGVRLKQEQIDGQYHDLILVSYDINDYYKDLTEDALYIKRIIEACISRNESIFDGINIRLQIEYANDSAPDSMVISNVDFTSGFTSSGTQQLSYGFFNMETIDLSHFSSDLNFEYLEFHCDNLYSVQNLITQTNLSNLVLKTKNIISEDDKTSIIDSHPNCHININGETY